MIDQPSAVRGALDEAARRVAGAPRVWLGTHVDPDGDAIGSLLGLAHVLSARGQVVVAACQDPPPREAAFLPGVERIVHVGPAEVDLAIALDAADSGRLGTLYDPATWAAAPTIVIDHHRSNPGFGDLDVIDPTAAATAELVVALADALGAPLSADAATCLLTGLVTDTLGFRTSSTTPRSLDCARRLMQDGADLAAIAQRVFFTQPLTTLRLTGVVLDRIEVDGPFALSWLTQADLAAHGVPQREVQGITQLLQTAAEPAAVAFVRERADGTFDVSLRAKPGVDVVPAAVALGGGGHPQAAGARIAGPLEAALTAVRRALAAHIAATSDPARPDR